MTSLLLAMATALGAAVLPARPAAHAPEKLNDVQLGDVTGGTVPIFLGPPVSIRFPLPVVPVPLPIPLPHPIVQPPVYIESQPALVR
jgi:hypothetical protein